MYRSTHRILHHAFFCTKANPKVSMSSIKQLRAKTGAPIQAVKQALQQNDGDMELALTTLRKLGAAFAATRAHRVAREGVIAIAFDDIRQGTGGGCYRKGAMIELNCETDFVARTETFLNVAKEFADLALLSSEGLVAGIHRLDMDVFAEQTARVNEKIADASAALGEKIELRRANVLQVSPETTSNASICGYVHGGTRHAATCGKLGVLIAMETPNDDDGLQHVMDGLTNVGRRVAMHIAAANPVYKTAADISAEQVSKEREVLEEMAKKELEKSGKRVSEDVLKRIVDGRLDKWMKDVVLEQQEMLVEMDGYQGKPRSVVTSIAEQVPRAKVQDFVRFHVGEEC